MSEWQHQVQILKQPSRPATVNTNTAPWSRVWKPCACSRSKRNKYSHTEKVAYLRVRNEAQERAVIVSVALTQWVLWTASYTFGVTLKRNFFRQCVWKPYILRDYAWYSECWGPTSCYSLETKQRRELCTLRQCKFFLATWKTTCKLVRPWQHILDGFCALPTRHMLYALSSQKVCWANNDLTTFCGCVFWNFHIKGPKKKLGLVCRPKKMLSNGSTPSSLAQFYPE